MEHDLLAGQPFPFTAEWYQDRDHAPHLEQGIHRERMSTVVALAADAVDNFGISSIVDLGAGDGGMLTLLRMTGVPCWGYDIAPRNVQHAIATRGVDVRLVDFVKDEIEWGQMAIMTEVLEHLEDPHKMVATVAKHCDFLIASSPSRETIEEHAPEHAWAWDMEGYAKLLTDNGYQVVEHNEVGDVFKFQVVFAMTR